MSADPFINRQLGDFIIRERIGQGGMAVVYRAFQSAVQRDVALKIIHLGDENWQDENFRLRFTKEAEVIAGLEHIHILPVYDYGFTEDAAYIAMRLLRGGTLRDLLRDGPLAIDHAADLFRQITRALAYAHSKGVIHRDLKPSNIMLDDAGNAFLTDFGLAKIVESSMELTRSGNLVGTPAYMSPEQLRGEAVNHRSDIYSLGVMLYYMLAGRPPFGGSTTDLVSTIYQHLEKAPPPLSNFNPNVPPGVEEVITRALRKNPAERYDNAGLMADDLYLALGRKISSTGHPVPRLLTPGEPFDLASLSATLRRHRPLLTVAAGVGAVLAVLAFVLFVIAALDSGGVETTSTPAPLRYYATVMPDVEAQAEEAEPSGEQIIRAQRVLGPDGFLAYVTCTLSTNYHATQAREMGDMAAAYGLKYRIYDSDTDKYNQLTQIEKARADGAKGLILCPLDPDVLDSALRSVQEAGIPLVILHSSLPNYGGVLLAGDDYLMGLEAGRFAGKLIAEERNGQAKVVILGYPDLPILVVRADGLQDGVLEYAPDAQIVGRYRGGAPDLAETSITKLIQDGVAFDVILSINDAGSIGAIRAMEAAGFDPSSVIISSIDAEPAALEYIREGYFMRGSLEVNREAFSRTAINAMIKLLAGATVPETFVVPPGEMISRDTLLAQAP